MFLKAITELPANFEGVRTALLSQPSDWLDDLASDAAADSVCMLLEVGLNSPCHQFIGWGRIDLVDAVSTERVVSLPIRLHFEAKERFFPDLEGSLDAAWLGLKRTHLALIARYEPPLNMTERSVDRALLHRVAETVAQRFLQSVAQHLASAVLL